MIKKTQIVAYLYYNNKEFDVIDLAPVDMATQDDNGAPIKDFAPYMDSWRVVQRWSVGSEFDGKYVVRCSIPMLARFPAGQYAVIYTKPRDVYYEIEDELPEEEPADLNELVWSTEEVLKREG